MGKSKNNVIDWDTYKQGSLIGLGKDRGEEWASAAPKKGAYLPRCYESHKPLKIVMPTGEELLIHGGSCISPIVKDADIYVGFEQGMDRPNKGYPWEQGDAFQFLINDGSVPPNIADFRKLLKYLSDALLNSKKVHIGCIGGHGRTGLVLAALVKHMTGNANATEFVRTNYCQKAVESHTQIDWLFTHFGIDKVKPSKSFISSYEGSKLSNDSFANYASSKGVTKNYDRNTIVTPSGFKLVETIKPVRVKGSVWGF